MQLEKKRRLKDIKVKEVSLVKFPANRTPFIFFKEESASSMEKRGLKCPECGFKPAGKLSSKRCPECGATLKGCEKKPEVTKMLDKKEISDILASFEKEDLEEHPLDLTSDYEGLVDEKMDEDQIKKADKLKPEVSKAIAAAMRSLSKWKADLPADAQKALALLAKLATGKYPYPAPYKKSADEEDIEKAGAKVSKFTGAEIAKAIKLLQAILPDGFMKALEEEAKEDDALTILNKIHDHIVAKEDKPNEDSGNKEGDEKKDGEESEIAKSLKKITERLEVIEKQSGVKKGLESDGSDGKESEDSEGGDPWASIDIG